MSFWDDFTDALESVASSAADGVSSAWHAATSGERAMAPHGGFGHGGGGFHGGGAYHPGGFYGRGGFYRHGSRYPGRWWNGGPEGIVWVESDVNLLADDPGNDAELDAIPPPSQDQAPIAPDAHGAPPADRDPAAVAVVQGWTDPLVLYMNAETNQRFWDRTGYKRGQRLNPRDPLDAKMIPLWISLRYEVAQEVHNDATQPYDAYRALAHVSAPGHDRSIVVGTAWRGRVSGDDRLHAIAPVLAPGARGFRVTFDLDAQRVLTVRLCCDGACYETRADLSQILGALDQRIRAYHESLHAGHASAAQSTIVGADPDLDAAKTALVAKMLAAHETALCAGWFDSITHAVSNAARGVTSSISHVASSAVGTVGHTLKSLKGPIAAAAGIAAGAGALAIPGVGPLVAPMAGSLANSLVNAAAGDGDAAQAAQQAIAAATTAAQSDPHVKAALDLAHKAVAQTTAAYHTVQTVANAAAGSQDAQAQVDELVDAASQGDAGAQKALAIANDATAAAAANSDAAATVSGAEGASPRAQASLAVQDFPSRVAGVVQRSDGTWQLLPFDSSDQADDWFGQWLGLPHAYLYVAYYDKGDATYPGPLNESIGTRGAHAAATSAGWILPFALGLPIGAAADHYGPKGWAWAKGKWDARKAAK